MISPDFLNRVWSAMVARVITYFPTILATLALLLAGFGISWLLGALARRVTRRLGLDRQVEESGLRESLARAGLSRPTSEIIGSLVFWLVYLCFLVLALQNLGLDLSALPVWTFVSYVPRLIGALILLTVGVLLAALLGRAAEAGLAGMGIASPERLGAMVRWVLIALMTIVTVDQLGFEVGLLTSTFGNLLTIAAAGMAIAFAWGGKEVARNLLAGYYVKETFRMGDVLVVDGHEGQLEEVGSLNSRLATARGSVLVPNSRLVESTVETREEVASDGL